MMLINPNAKLDLKNDFKDNLLRHPFPHDLLVYPMHQSWVVSADSLYHISAEKSNVVLEKFLKSS